VPAGAAVPAPVAPKPATNVLTQLVLSAQGSWKSEGDKYTLALQDEKNQNQKADVVAEEGRLLIKHPALTLVFARAEQ